MESDMRNQLIQAATDYIHTLFLGNSGGHDAEHSYRVYRNAMRIAAEEPEADLEIVALAALLHDADDYKLFNTQNNDNARSFLEAQSLPTCIIDAICKAINSVSFSKNRGTRPETLEGQIVQDADRLDAIGAIGIARTFAYGGEHGRSLDSSIQHFHDKLLLLKDEMNTASAKKIAESRHSFLLTFLAEYSAETQEQK